MRLKISILLIFILSACSFITEEANQWHLVSRNESNNKFQILIDTQRISKKNENDRKLWLKVEFDNLTPVAYESTENKTKIIQSKQIRMESNFNCSTKELKVANYLIYNIDGQVAYTNWLNYPIKNYLNQENIKADLYQYLCLE